MTSAVVTDTIRVPARDNESSYAPLVQLAYEPNDPYAVWLHFPEDEDNDGWAFSRYLLTEGTRAEAGQGKVRVFPCGRTVHIALITGDGPVVHDLPAAYVKAFLAATYEAVPAGSEATFLDVDRAISRLLEDA